MKICQIKDFFNLFITEILTFLISSCYKTQSILTDVSEEEILKQMSGQMKLHGM